MIGVTLNSYKIVKKISEGGMGEIYLAEHKFLERKAAVKILHKTYSGNKDIRQRFIQEAQTLSRLDHPYIVKIFDFDQYQDVFYIIMEFVSGYTLEEYTRVKNGLMPEHIAKDFFVKVLSAVNYAHNNSIVHRDIKPSNIMIDANNDPKILDFGIARLLNADQRVTRVNTKMGSILYMSPEQILGKEVDFKSDIYSLGITFYETLTAIHPYDIEEDSDFTLQSKILNDYPPPPSAYYPMITKQIEYVISNAINKDPGDRFSSCQEFSEAISDPYYTGEYLYSDREVKPVVHHNPADLKPPVTEDHDAQGGHDKNLFSDNEGSFGSGKVSDNKLKELETQISGPVSEKIIVEKENGGTDNITVQVASIDDNELQDEIKSVAPAGLLEKSSHDTNTRQYSNYQSNQFHVKRKSKTGKLLVSIFSLLVIVSIYFLIFFKKSGMENTIVSKKDSLINNENKIVNDKSFSRTDSLLENFLKKVYVYNGNNYTYPLLEDFENIKIDTIVYVDLKGKKSIIDYPQLLGDIKEFELKFNKFIPKNTFIVQDKSGKERSYSVNYSTNNQKIKVSEIRFERFAENNEKPDKNKKKFRKNSKIKIQKPKILKFKIMKIYRRNLKTMKFKIMKMNRSPLTSKRKLKKNPMILIVILKKQMILKNNALKPFCYV